MAVIPYVDGATPIDAARWNTLFSAFDAKLTTVFDGKTPLLLGAIPDEICGKVFVFAPDEASRTYSNLMGGLVYDHQVFVDGLADFDDSELFMWDADKHIVCLKRNVDQSFRDAIGLPPEPAPGLGPEDGFFDQSLQAHTRDIDGTPHYVLEPRVHNIFIPEKKWNYGQAEILLDGGTTSVTWDAAWDKYAFLRFHNLHSTAATITFPATATFPGLVLTIPRWATRCVRRKDGIYSAGFHYLQRMESGDPRMIHYPNERQTPWGSQGSNNVFSLKVIHDWLMGVTQPTAGWGLRGPRLMLDPELLHDITSLYAGKQFAQPNDNALIGDLLIHAGMLLSIKTDALGAITEQKVLFNGFAIMPQRFGPAGIGVTDNDDGTFTLESTDPDAVHHELWGITTNLLATNPVGSADGYDVHPGVDLKAGFTTANHGPNVQPTIHPLVQQVTSNTYQWNTLGTESGGDVPLAGVDDVELNVDKSAPGEIYSASSPIQMGAWTVADVKSLEVYGTGADGPLNNERGSYASSNLRLSEGGVLLTWRRNLSLNWLLTGAPGDPRPSIDSGFFQGIDATIGTWDQKVSVSFSGVTVTSGFTFRNWGWPEPGLPDFLDCRLGYRFYADTPADPLFIYDSDTDTKIEAANLHHHPNIINETENTDGKDWEIDPDIDEDAEVRDISILRPISLGQIEPNPLDPAADQYIFGGYLAPDILRELLDDQKAGYTTYAANRVAWLANTQQVKFRIVRRNLVREDYNYLASLINACTKARPFVFSDFLPWSDVGLGSGDFKEHLEGLYGGPFFPATMYASFPEGGDLHNLYSSLGVPIKTKADLPSDLQAVKNTLQKQFNVKTAYDIAWEYLSTEPWGAGLVKHHYTHHWTVGDTTIENFATIPGSSLFDPAIFEGPGGSDDFFWVTSADVQALAESMGFKFWMERLTIPYKITIFNVFPDPVLLHSEPDSQDYPYEEIVSSGEPNEGGRVDHQQYEWSGDFGFFTGNYGRMIQCLTNETPTWLRALGTAGEYTQLIAISKDHAGDVITAKDWIPGPDFFTPFSILVARFLLESNENRFLREDATYIRHPENDTTDSYHVRKTPCLYHQSVLSTGLNRLRKLVLHGIPTVQHSTSQFSVESYTQALGRLQHGTSVIPLEILPADANQTPSILDLTNQAQMIPPPGANQCFEILYFKDWPVSV